MHRTMHGWLGLSGVGWLAGCPEPAIKKPIPAFTALRQAAPFWRGAGDCHGDPFATRVRPLRIGRPCGR